MHVWDKDEAMNDTPVAVVCYNRPRHTARVLESLLEHNIQNLYIFVDGPKVQEDVEKINTIKRLVGTIRWTTPRVICQDVNRGLARSVVGAVNYVMQSHDQLILLEDDCVPGEFFFEFMDTCLDKYRDNERIFGINGYTVPIPEDLLSAHPYDLYFYPRIGSWGWATWKRAWRHFDPDLSKLYKEALARGVDLTQGGADIPSQVQRVLGGHDAWTLNWVLATYLNGGCYVYPTRSHVQNIGFDGSGTNFGTSRCRFENSTSSCRPMRYPADVVINHDLINHYNSYFRPKSKAASGLASGPRRQSSESSLSIVHINTHDVAGGAAKVGERLAEAQRAKGHGAVMLVGTKNCDSPHSFAFDVEHDSSLVGHCRSKGQLYYESQGSHRLVNNQHVKNASILHLHNLHGYYFNPFSLSALSQLKPVVWTLHDMQAFTGHCAYSLGCDGWRTGCLKCDHLEIPPEIPIDTAGRLLADKKLIYDHCHLQLVTPSKWLKDMVEKSVLKDHPVELIYNGVDTSTFCPSDKANVRAEFGIAADALVIGAVANGSTLGNPFKGGYYTQDALRLLSQQLVNHVFVNIGGRQTGRQGNIIYIPRISDEQRLAQAYSMLDIFLYTPLADNCPLVILEALACGVPIVTFDTGGVGELVRNGIDGFVIEHGNAAKAVEAVGRLATDSSLRSSFSRNARQAAVNKYDHAIAVDKYERLYRHVLQPGRTRTPKIFAAADIPDVIRTPAFEALERHKSGMAHSKAGSRASCTIPPAPEYDVSIVVGTKNRAQMLDRMLGSLKAATAGIRYEVIVIEGGSTDNTLQVLQQHRIGKIYSEKQCLGDGRHGWPKVYNAGFTWARGKWAMYGSDDIIYGEGCLQRAFNILNRHGDEVAAGLFFYKNLYTRPDWDRFGIDFMSGDKLLVNFGMFRLDSFRQVGGLSDEYNFYCADTDLCYRFYHHGLRTIVLPECFVVHDNALDRNKREHADESRRDIELYRERWKHFVSMEQPAPRRLLWHEDYIDALSMPSMLAKVPAGVEHYWHGLACLQYGMWGRAQAAFTRAVEGGLDHELVRRLLDQASTKYREPGSIRKSLCTGRGLMAEEAGCKT